MTSKENEIHILLDRPIAYHRVFVTLTGSVQAAVMLSQAFYWSKRTSDPEGYFYKTANEWEDETGLTRREQETARKHLNRTNFWSEKLKGVPARMFYKIDSMLLFSSFDKSAKLDSQILQKRQTSFDKSAKHSTTETTTETTYEDSKESSSQEALFTEIPETKKSKAKTAKNGADPVYRRCVEIWLKEIHPGWTFGGMHGKAIKSIIKKLYAISTGLVTGDEIVSLFEKMMHSLPSWYQDKDLSVLDSKFNEIITEIRNGKPAPRKGPSTWDIINNL